MKTIMRLICVALLFWCLTELHAGPQRISQGLAGKVVDSYSVPIGNALIVVHSEREQTASVFPVDKAGGFDIELPLGTYDVMATARAFVPASAKVEVISGKVSKFNPKLHADVAHMEN